MLKRWRRSWLCSSTGSSRISWMQYQPRNFMSKRCLETKQASEAGHWRHRTQETCIRSHSWGRQWLLPKRIKFRAKAMAKWIGSSRTLTRKRRFCCWRRLIKAILPAHLAQKVKIKITFTTQRKTHITREACWNCPQLSSLPFQKLKRNQFWNIQLTKSKSRRSPSKFIKIQNSLKMYLSHPKLMISQKYFKGEA